MFYLQRAKVNLWALNLIKPSQLAAQLWQSKTIICMSTSHDSEALSYSFYRSFYQYFAFVPLGTTEI